MDLGRGLLLKQSEPWLILAWPGFLCYQPAAVPNYPKTLYQAVPPHLLGCLQNNVARDVSGVSGSALHPGF